MTKILKKYGYKIFEVDTGSSLTVKSFHFLFPSLLVSQTSTELTVALTVEAG